MASKGDGSAASWAAAEKRSAARNATPPPRHYPLDIPGTRFDRYHHRLTARDILVHRIMAEYMSNHTSASPPRLSADVYDSWIKFPPTFGQIKAEDSQLGLDLALLQKLLSTTYSEVGRSYREPLVVMIPTDGHTWRCNCRQVRVIVEGPANKPPTVGDQVLDLVMRHYLETDDLALKFWLALLRPPQESLWSPVDGKASQEGLTQWAAQDTQHMQRLRPQLAVRDQLPLYDGGVYTPKIRRELDYYAVGCHGARRGLGVAGFLGVFGLMRRAVLATESAILNMPVTLGNHRSSHFIMQPVWETRRGFPHPALESAKLLVSNAAGSQVPCISPIYVRDGYWGLWPGLAPLLEERYGRSHRRCGSEPPPGSFVTMKLPFVDGPRKRIKLEILCPRLSLAELDRRSRRRSLSRSRIRDMFDIYGGGDEPGAAQSRNLNAKAAQEPPPNSSGMPKLPASKSDAGSLPPPRCGNCAKMSHGTLECHSPCGHCGAPNPKARPDIQKYADVPWLESYDHPIHNQQPHVASDCPVARQNRCKCVPFPTFHVAARCGIACSRSCGNGAPRGSFQHPNAMLCKSRCCMCGLRGHSGRECRLKKCRCGDAHLGQDCTWNPVCRVPDCDRYLCGMHCRECGSMEKPFLRWRCGRCLGFDGPLQWGDRKDSRRRGKVGLPGGDERAEAPASAPQNQTELAASEATTPPSSLFGGPRQPYKKDGSLDATSNEK